jgi:RNA polymerase sigma-70 factor, ECF subfamily
MLRGEDNSLVQRMLGGDESAFSFIFKSYYADLVLFADTFVRDRQAAEEITQDIFIRLWENRESVIITSSLRSFLLKSVQNKCIDTIRHLKIVDGYQSEQQNHPLLLENDTENYVLYSELEDDLKKALGKLPDDISRIFLMNRFEGFTYPEIASQLNLSVRMVEIRMGKALALLKNYLKEYLISIFLIFTIM